MYGDTDVIRGLARTLRDQAESLRAEASDLRHRAEAVPWTGVAADAMRVQVLLHAKELVVAADLADHAAAALERHADEVDRLKALIARIEHAVMSMVRAARDRLAGLISGLLPDPVDQLLDRFVPPPPGDRAWLDVQLPGLAL